MNRSLVFCLAVLLGAVVEAAAADDGSLYREGQPEVLNAAVERLSERKESEAQLVASFRKDYVRVGRPKILLLWHRDLSDDITSHKEITQTVSSSGGQAVVPTRVGPQVAVVPPSHQSVTLERNEDFARPVSLLPPAKNAEFESGFQSALRAAGVQLVDRNTVIRLVARDKAAAGEKLKAVDRQDLEMSALVKHADYFMELNFVPDAESRQGVEPRVTVIKTTTGEIMADVVPSELYKADRAGKRWVATDAGFVESSNDDDISIKADERGFVKERRKRTGAEEGRMVALAAMKGLLDAWSTQVGQGN